MARKNGNTDERYQARLSFGYGDQTLDVGQVIRLKGLTNDAKLIEHRYLIPFEGKETYICNVDGTEFATDWQRVAHGEKVAPQTHYEKVEAVERARIDRRHPDLVHEVRA